MCTSSIATKVFSIPYLSQSKTMPSQKGFKRSDFMPLKRMIKLFRHILNWDSNSHKNNFILLILFMVHKSKNREWRNLWKKKFWLKNTLIWRMLKFRIFFILIAIPNIYRQYHIINVTKNEWDKKKAFYAVRMAVLDPWYFCW